MRFPSIRDVARDLRGISANVECDESFSCPVRLQVWASGGYCVWSGDPSCDTDHTGFWAASYVPGVVAGKVVRFNSYSVARDLLEQCRDHYAQSEID